MQCYAMKQTMALDYDDVTMTFPLQVHCTPLRIACLHFISREIEIYKKEIKWKTKYLKGVQCYYAMQCQWNPRFNSMIMEHGKWKMQRKTDVMWCHVMWCDIMRGNLTVCFHFFIPWKEKEWNKERKKERRMYARMQQKKRELDRRKNSNGNNPKRWNEIRCGGVALHRTLHCIR